MQRPMCESHRAAEKRISCIPVVAVDERYSSKMAKGAMIEMGMKKMQRRDKSMVDKIAATIILQEYMERKATGQRDTGVAQRLIGRCEKINVAAAWRFLNHGYREIKEGAQNFIIKPKKDRVVVQLGWPLAVLR